MILKFILATALLMPPFAGAQTSASNESAATTTPSVTPITSGNSINPAAQTGKKSQDNGAMMNMIAAAALMAACMATQPPNMALCMMGAMAGMQAGADQDASDQSNATYNASANGGSTGTNTGATDPNYAAAATEAGGLSSQKKTIAAGMQTLSAAGYKVSPSGISSSSGTIPASAFSSSGSMLAAGLDANAVKQAEKIGADVAAKYNTMSIAADNSGGGGGGNGTGGSDGSGEDSSKGPKLPDFKNPFAIDASKKAELMSGKTVQFDGEPIGVKGDNIFQMVHLAYQRKRAGNHFIESDHDPALNAVRAPASVPKALGITVAPTINPASLPKLPPPLPKK